MDTTLLATKLFIPTPGPGLVARPRLMERLDGAASCRLVLVSAPAGFGKTTALTQWIRQRRLPAAWLSLGDGENDPVRFWEYAIAALRTVRPAAGGAVLPLLRSSRPPPIETMLAPLINDIAAVPGEFILVLDDYHAIQSEAVHKGMSFLLEHMPPEMHLVIATRADPPLQLARWRGAGMLTEIRANDLRFDLDEAAGLLAGLGIPPLSPADLESLNARAEGWVTGLKMAGLSMQGQRDSRSFVAALSGSQRYIMDYLIEEVLQKQDREVRDFLLQTSVLERLSGSLCNAVTQGSSGQETLLRLDRANLFLVPLDASREWYRYHHLFADLLQNRLEAESGRETRDNLHRRASGWYEAAGFHEDAVGHALKGHDWRMAMDLVPGVNAMAAYGGPTTYNWLSQVPREALLTHPQACVQFAWALGFTGRFESLKAFLDDCEKSGDYDPAQAGQIALLRAYAAAHQHDPAAEAYARKALDLLPPEDVGWRALATMHVGIYRLLVGRYDEAEPPLLEACDALQGTDESFGLAMGLTNLGVVNTMRGRLRRAEELFGRAIALAAGNPGMAPAHFWLGSIHIVRNDLEAGTAEMEKSMALSLPDSENMATALLMLFGIRLSRGDAAGAEEVLLKAERVPVAGDAAAKHRAWIAACRVALAAARGDAESVSRWLDGCSVYQGFESEMPAAAMGLLLERRREETLKQLEADHASFREHGLGLLVVRACVARAVASEDRDGALSLLAEATAIGRPEGFIRPFSSWGMELAPLLRRAVLEGIEAEYARKLLAIIEAEDLQRRAARGGGGARRAPSGLLTDRETEVVRLVAEGLSNQEIADRLKVSLTTARTHVYHAFDKLNARDRVQAITRARELRLI